jgi:outer membrane protein TolC
MLATALTLVLLAAPAAPQETLTLEAALAEAERASPDLAAARARLDAARTGVARARAGYLPQVTAGATYTRYSDEVVLPPPFSITVQETNQYAAQIELTQAILAPELWFAMEGAGKSSRAAGETYEFTRRELRHAVAQAYYGASAAEQSVGVQERQLAVARAHEKDARAQVEAGIAAKIVLLRAGVDRASAEQDLVRAQNVLASAKSAIAALLGRSEGADFALARPAAPPLPADLSALEDEALRRRRDLRAADLSVDAAGAARRAVTARYAPTLGAFGQARWVSAGGFAADQDSWLGGLALSWNIFDGGLREADRREAGARLAEAEASRSSLAVRARDEVRQARLDFESARANRIKAEESVALARENQRLVEASFRAGTATSLEATDANAALATAELRLVVDGLAADRAALRLLRSAGLDGE